MNLRHLRPDRHPLSALHVLRALLARGARRAFLPLGMAVPIGSLVAQPAPTVATPTFAEDSIAVMRTLQGFVDALREKRAADLVAHMHPSARLTLLRPQPNGPDPVTVVVMSAAQFAEATSRPDGPTYDEPIRNPRIQRDGDLANVWAEYQVRMNGRVSHCGFDAFHLVRTRQGWRILNVSDTLRRDGCGTPWP